MGLTYDQLKIIRNTENILELSFRFSYENLPVLEKNKETNPITQEKQWDEHFASQANGATEMW
jgi:hypothetical protein